MSPDDQQHIGWKQSYWAGWTFFFEPLSCVSKTMFLLWWRAIAIRVLNFQSQYEYIEHKLSCLWIMDYCSRHVHNDLPAPFPQYKYQFQSPTFVKKKKKFTPILAKFALESFYLSIESQVQSRTCICKCPSCAYSQKINIKAQCLAFLVQSLGMKLQVLIPVAHNSLLQWYCLINNLLLHQETCYLQFNHILFPVICILVYEGTFWQKH